MPRAVICNAKARFAEFPEVLDAWYRAGAVWGGDWDGDKDTLDERRCDGMHWQFARLRNDQPISRKDGFNVSSAITSNIKIPVIIVAKLGDNSSYIADLQNMLIRKGAKIAADGDFGPKTEQAVREFQQKNGLSVTGSIDTDTLSKLMV